MTNETMYHLCIFVLVFEKVQSSLTIPYNQIGKSLSCLKKKVQFHHIQIVIAKNPNKNKTKELK